MPKFRKKPVVVEAEQFWPGTDYGNHPPGVRKDKVGFFVTTIHGQRTAVSAGDWIILEPGQDGAERPLAYPCKPDIFEATYEAVEEEEK